MRVGHRKCYLRVVATWVGLCFHDLGITRGSDDVACELYRRKTAVLVLPSCVAFELSSSRWCSFPDLLLLSSYIPCPVQCRYTIYDNGVRA